MKRKAFETAAFYFLCLFALWLGLSSVIFTGRGPHLDIWPLVAAGVVLLLALFARRSAAPVPARSRVRR